MMKFVLEHLSYKLNQYQTLHWRNQREWVMLHKYRKNSNSVVKKELQIEIDTFSS